MILPQIGLHSCGSPNGTGRAALMMVNELEMSPCHSDVVPIRMTWPVCSWPGSGLANEPNARKPFNAVDEPGAGGHVPTRAGLIGFRVCRTEQNRR
jgi:hypothetical protein